MPKTATKIGDIMTRSLIVYTKPERHVNQGIETMVHRGIGSILILDGKDWGIVTRKDIVKKVLAKGKDPAKVTCKEIMTKPIITIDRNATINDALKVMVDKDVRRLGVTEDGNLVGLVSNRDILAQWVERHIVRMP